MRRQWCQSRGCMISCFLWFLHLFDKWNLERKIAREHIGGPKSILAEWGVKSFLPRSPYFLRLHMAHSSIITSHFILRGGCDCDRTATCIRSSLWWRKQRDPNALFIIPRPPYVAGKNKQGRPPRSIRRGPHWRRLLALKGTSAAGALCRIGSDQGTPLWQMRSIGTPLHST